ncbi:hypothetical protein CLG96_09865 [Sphingomonas oleivorans]|uniref:Uncharacterized protein n=1 Tax=Sphingomonas oleivorans TaxID=1735121 RepID=A0A2T5FX52_9SPHN|nr:hypothetical protein CLG96_09865 [Sphingomonas oleivorans]
MAVVALSGTLLSGPAAAEVKQPGRLLAMTPAAFQSSALVEEDELEFDTLISTEPGFTAGRSLLRIVWNDNHLRAIVDRRTGATRYEVHQFIRYAGPRRAYRSVNYATPAGLQRAEMLKAEHGADICPNVETNGDCVLTKRLSFAVDEPLLRAIAASYRQGGSESWNFKFKEEGGHDLRAGIVPAEVAGLLMAVDGYKANRGLDRLAGAAGDGGAIALAD